MISTGISKKIAIVLALFSVLLLTSGLRLRRTTEPGRQELREAMYYQKLPDKQVRCNLCHRECLIPEGKRGFCRVRENRNGTLYSLVYGKPVGLQIDPVEKEPMYHFFPGHRNLCVFTAGCNFRCRHCHNWHVSQRGFEEVRHETYTPSEIVAEALRLGCKSVSHSINEPTVFFEYMYDIARAAQEKGVKVIFHTNGYISEEPLKDLLRFVDGVTVDLKGFNDRFYREIPEAELEPVLTTLKTIREADRHLEIVYLIIPGLNDDLNDIENMSAWIMENLGDDVPLHFNRFFPSYRLTEISPTPIATLEKARDTARAAGIKYVYIGNVAGHEGNHTYCPVCNEELIRRSHFFVIDKMIGENGKCKNCGEQIAGVFE